MSNVIDKPEEPASPRRGSVLRNCSATDCGGDGFNVSGAYIEGCISEGNAGRGFVFDETSELHNSSAIRNKNGGFVMRNALKLSTQEKQIVRAAVSVPPDFPLSEVFEALRVAPYQHEAYVQKSTEFGAFMRKHGVDISTVVANLSSFASSDIGKTLIARIFSDK